MTLVVVMSNISISRPSGSQPKIAPKSSSRPSITPVTGTTQPGMRPVGSFQGTNPGSRPSGMSIPGTNPGTNPGAPAFGASVVGDRPAAQPKSSIVIYILVGVLIVAIGVLAVLLMSS